jgi:hypothetical protein
MGCALGAGTCFLGAATIAGVSPELTLAVTVLLTILESLTKVWVRLALLSSYT